MKPLLELVGEHAIPYLRTFPSVKVWLPNCASAAEADAAAGIFRAAGLLPRTMIYATSTSDVVLSQLRRSAFDHLTFATHNLATDASFNEFQLIACLNRITLSQRALGLLNQSLCRFGLLAISVGEHELSIAGAHYVPFAPDILKKIT